MLLWDRSHWVVLLLLAGLLREMASNPYAVRKTATRNRWAAWSRKGRAAQALEPAFEDFTNLGPSAPPAKCEDDDDEVRGAEAALDPGTAALAARQARADRMREIVTEEIVTEDLHEPEPELQQQRSQDDPRSNQAGDIAGPEKLERQTLTLSRSYIHNFDGEYRYVGQANQKPHWQSESNMHLYWGPHDRWLLRSRFTPDEPTASAYCDDESLFMGDMDFSWSKAAQWVASKLYVAPASKLAAHPADRLNQTNGDSPNAPKTLRLSQCFVDIFDGTYELVGQSNGHPHWCCHNGSPSGLHLYQGPPDQGLWLLRSKFNPSEKACSAYCSCSHTPTGSNLWHWMQNGEWVAQELELVAADADRNGGAAAAVVAVAMGHATADTVSQWTFSEESVPPREAGPWDVKAADVAAAARQAGASATAGASSSALASGDGSDDIVEQLAEYIRSIIFDTDGMGEECHVLAAFEERACLAFETPIEDGFTFEQQALHREFCALFVSVCGTSATSSAIECTTSVSANLTLPRTMSIRCISDLVPCGVIGLCAGGLHI